MNPIKIYTIGFTKKTAKEFFEKLTSNGVIKIIDIRLNNTSQLAGFTKSDDLKYFLDKICNIQYIHKPEYAPTEDILKKYKKKRITWEDYEKAYVQTLTDRNILSSLEFSELDHACLLCSEQTAQKCHRRLLAEYLRKNNQEIVIFHL